jgi:hypothetical protein
MRVGFRRAAGCSLGFQMELNSGMMFELSG